MWSHPKIKNKKFLGNYEYAKSGKRVLFLEHFNEKGKKVETHKFTCWLRAKQAGWKYAI